MTAAQRRRQSWAVPLLRVEEIIETAKLCGRAAGFPMRLDIDLLYASLRVHSWKLGYEIGESESASAGG